MSAQNEWFSVDLQQMFLIHLDRNERRGAYQYDKGYESQKMTIKYNKDGTVYIVNGDGLYLDIEEGEAVSDATLIFAPKSGKSSQKFVFNYVW